MLKSNRITATLKCLHIEATTWTVSGDEGGQREDLEVTSDCGTVHQEGAQPRPSQVPGTHGQVATTRGRDRWSTSHGSHV